MNDFELEKTLIIIPKELKTCIEFKLDALNHLQEGKSISDISKNLGIRINMLYTWHRLYQLHSEKFQGLAIRLPKNEQQKKTPLSQ